MDNKIVFGLLMMAAVLPAKALGLHNPLNDSPIMLLDSSRVVDLDEVVVIAQPKESYRLRRQPLSSSVFTSNEMHKLNVQSLSQISCYVPSFVMPAYGSRLTSSIYVRGIGSRTGDPAVGVYYDNIPLVNKGSYNNHFYQLDRVDVLRGPQGTLYGMNTEGGIVRLYSKNPMTYQGTDIQLGIGTGMQTNAEVAHYKKLSDKFAFSAAAFYSGLRGFFNNTNFDEKADKSNEAGGRLRFVWSPTQRLTFDLSTDYQYVNQNAFAYGEYDNATGDYTDPNTTILNGYRRQMVNTGLNISYKAPSFLLTSTTSYQYLNDKMLMDQDYLPADYMRLEQMQKLNALTQEITLRSLRLGSWQHTSGLFFSYQWLRTDAPVYFGDAMNSMIISNMGMPPAVAQNMSLTDNYVPGTFRTPQLNMGIYHESNINLTDRFMVTLGLRYDYQRVEIDYNTQSHFLLGYSGMSHGAPINTSNHFRSILHSSASKDYNQLLPKFALTYKLDNSGSNVYATVSKGFRAGGYNLQMFSDIFQSEQQGLGMKLMQLMQGDMTLEHTDADYNNISNTIAYEPEESWNYELGTHLNLFGGKLHADISTFYMQIRNQQLSVMAGDYGYGRMMINAGKSSSCGLELALRGNALDDHLSWAATYSYTHSTFRQYSDSISVGSGKDKHNEPCDYKGNHVPFIPKHTFSLMADYRIDISKCSVLKSITIGANVAGNGETYWDVDNLYSQKLYALLGAHASLDMGMVTVNLWGRNLTDTKYNTFLINSSIDRTNRSFAQRGTPFQVGVDLSLHL